MSNLNSGTREKEMKQFVCAMLVPGVEQIIRADTDANVMARAVENLKSVLGEDPSEGANVPSRSG